MLAKYNDIKPKNGYALKMLYIHPIICKPNVILLLHDLIYKQICKNLRCNIKKSATIKLNNIKI